MLADAGAVVPLTGTAPAPFAVSDQELEQLEIELLMEAVRRRYGYDFSDYRPEPLLRSVQRFRDGLGQPTLTQVIGRVLREPAFFFELLSALSINVTAMFRDSRVFAALRQQVLPMLRTWPHAKVWDAGCATGEEAYSLAVMLHETGLLDRTIVYATDISAPALQTAKAGIYPLETIRQGQVSYLESGGPGPFSNYYLANGNAAIMDGRLRNRIVFARHNLVTDAAFGDMQLICCRNVLIYFNEDLQDRVLHLFGECLDVGGYLVLGERESLLGSKAAAAFEPVCQLSNIYRKKRGL